MTATDPVPGHSHLPAALGAWSPVVAVVAMLALAYLAAVMRAGTGPHRWPGRRTAVWLLGCAMAVVALSPVLAGHDPAAHMARHLLLGMLAPLGLVLGAPVTLLLRVTEPATGRRISRVLRARPVHVLVHPAVTALLAVGGLYAVLLTPLAEAADTHPVLHDALLIHYLAAGYLFTWSIAGPDPAPPGMPTRVVALVLAVAAHSVLAEVLCWYRRRTHAP